MSKKVLLGKKAIEKLLIGLDTVADLVGGTIGPKGLNTYLKDADIPKITNDGAKIASLIYLKDPEEDAGAYVIRNVSGQQNDVVGDGTTTVSVLTQALVHECLKRPENGMEIMTSLKDAGDRAVKLLEKQSTKVSKGDVEKVALISAENKEIAHFITKIINELGEEAVINVEDSRAFNSEYEIIEGYEASVGYMSPKFADKTGKVVFEDVPVFVTLNKISTLQDIISISQVFQAEKIGACVFVCQDVDDSMLGVFITSNNAGTIKNVVIRATDWLLKDIEGLTGAKMISPTNGLTFQNFGKEHLGFAKKVVSDPNTTLFVTDGVAAKKYAKYLELQAENDPNMFSSKQTMKRVDKLKGKVAILRIGAATDFERDYLRLKADDSVKAVQAALEEGYVEGGGMTLWRLSSILPNKTVGQQILKKALIAPLKRIIENAGKDYAEIISNMPKGLGYNALHNRYENLIEAGVIDPTKVERCAIENAISAASTVITTFALVTEEDNAKDKI